MKRSGLRPSLGSVVPSTLAAFVALGSVSGYSSNAIAQTVGDIARSGACDSAPTNPLQMQIIATHRCMYPDDLADFRAGGGITFVGNVLPAINADTAARLRRAAAMSPIQMTSGYRTIAGQYVLSRSNSPSCMTPAAVGSSPHHTGRAIDASNYGAILRAMQAAGCEQSYPANDPVHFNCPGWTDNTLKAHSIAAFQRLWNVNHPMQRIVEDGAYGPQTEGVLVQSPVAGFAIPDGCPRNTPPRGDLNSANCNGAAGWAQDPDEPMRAIDVHLYIDGTAGMPGAMGFPLRAGDNRPDLCMPLGSCNHAFTWVLPEQFKDGRMHTIRAHGIDTAGGDNPQVGPTLMFTCQPTPPVMDAGMMGGADVPTVTMGDAMSDAGAMASDGNAMIDVRDAGNDVEYVRLPDGNLVPIDSLPGCHCRTTGHTPRGDSQSFVWSMVALAGLLGARRRRRIA